MVIQSNLTRTYLKRNMLVIDRFERPLFLFANEFTFNRFKERHEELELVEALDVNNEIQVD
ncbi:hypothetical protein ACFWM3_14500 [Gottfriedia sp. NPDC058432]|uniref:hypothetical protein n=1 Tax=Gottfriedia sp. NPDC058432 TaxID=3346497 RepID=UPI00364F3D4A